MNKEYIIESFPPRDIRKQQQLKAYVGGGWSLESLEEYINSIPHEGYALLQVIRNGSDMIIVWRLE